jgi:hypothetical protein
VSLTRWRLIRVVDVVLDLPRAAFLRENHQILPSLGALPETVIVDVPASNTWDPEIADSTGVSLMFVKP